VAAASASGASAIDSKPPVDPTNAVILASIVVPLAALAVVCWIFWEHRHDD
jgi:multisubunit Na+/H+ antiporter MnhC subunit